MQTVVSTPIELLGAAEEFSQMILSSYIYKNYIDTRREMLNDSDAHQFIANFNHVKEKFEEVQRFGKYHPDYSEVAKEIRIAKREMDLCDTVAAYRKAERALEKLLIEVSEVISSSVSPSIKVPSGNPYFDSSSCSGGCGSGGSCSCS